MARMIQIDAAALKRDYEEGMSWPELLKKYDGARALLRQRLRVAGAKMRARGRRAGPKTAGEARARLTEKPEDRGVSVSRGGSFLSADAATDLASLLDKQWARFTLVEKIRAIDQADGRRAEE